MIRYAPSGCRLLPTGVRSPRPLTPSVGEAFFCVAVASREVDQGREYVCMTIAKRTCAANILARRESARSLWLHNVQQPIVRRGPSEELRQEDVRAKSGQAPCDVTKSARPPGCAIFLAASGGVAMAQDRPRLPARNIDEVVVTGIRKSIQDSIGAKKDEFVDRRGRVGRGHRQAAGCFDRRGDRADCPALPRSAPTVARRRCRSAASGPDFTVTTFNGREQASTNDNRTVEFDQYPSELVTQVKIYKTPDAGMAYQGIAGTTDIATVHPLAYRRSQVGVRLQARDERPGSQHPRPAGRRRSREPAPTSISSATTRSAWRSASRTTRRPYQAQTREPWGYPDVDGDGPRTDLIIGGDKDGVQSSFYKRTAFMGVLEFKPNDQLHMLLDAYHSDFQEVQTIQRMEYGTIWAGATLDRIQARSKMAACSPADFPTCRSWSSRTTTTTAKPRSIPSA